ncbi:helix-turn-helix transcriptional regulator [Bacillus pumilus]|uniref:helix-turn-helix transcriptional regulator n=1 Tax=Bacillus pumilus TaxID=1408 RepID=UPI001C92E965|nr:helix-turn-helix transcriptional regulator [Bacillus pumilus]
MKNEIGNKIRQARLSKGLTAAQVANNMDVSQATMSNIENGKFGTRYSTLLLITRLFGHLDLVLSKEISDYFNHFIEDDKNKINVSGNNHEGFKEVESIKFHSTSIGQYSGFTITVTPTFTKENADDQLLAKGHHLIESATILKAAKKFFKDEDVLNRISNLTEKQLDELYDKKINSNERSRIFKEVIEM